MIKHVIFFLFWYFLYPILLLPQALETDFSINDGLSQNSALTILQDTKGFIWVGTKDGLNRFDGAEFKIYRNLPSKNSLVNNGIRYLYQDSKNNIWIGTSNGLSQFNLETEQFKSFLQQKNNSKRRIIYAVLEDSKKNIWVGTNDGLSKIIFKKNKFIEEAAGNSIQKFFQNMVVTCFYEDNDKNVWIGTYGDGLYCVSGENSEIKKIDLDAQKKLGNSTKHISTISNLNNQKFIVGTYGAGVFVSDSQKKIFSEYIPKFDDKTGIDFVAQIITKQSGTFVLTNRRLYKIGNTADEILWKNIKLTSPSSFIIDNSGIIWIGSNGSGLIKLEQFNKKFISCTKANGLLFSSIRAILKVDNSLFVGGYTGLLVSENYSQSNNVEWKSIKSFEGINVYSLAKDSVEKDVIWVGSEGNGLLKYNLKKSKLKRFFVSAEQNQEKFLSNFVYKILVAKNGDVYFGTGNGVARLNYKTRIFTNFIHKHNNRNCIVDGGIISILEDSAGNIWFGSDGEGVSVFNPGDNSFRNYLPSSNPKNTSALNGKKVNDIYEDKNGNIWIGTSNGLFKLSPDKTYLKIFRSTDGLPNDNIYGILEDNSGCLWVSTNIGISKFNIRNEEFHNYDYQFGLQSNEFNSGAYFKDKNGEMFFGGIEGITSFFAEEIKETNYAPKVVITNFKKYNQAAQLPKSISFTDKILLSYNDYFFSFDFAMPFYEKPTHHKFMYKLSGLDERWITLSRGEKTASFTGVAPGKYILVVKGANSDGIWTSEETKLEIEIQPAFWNTWWFRTIGATFLLSIAFALLYSRIGRLKHEKEIQKDLTNKLINAQEEDRKNISSELHDDLGQNLLVVKNRLLLARRDKTYDENINETLDVLDNSITKVSNISHLLHPSELEELGLAQAIETMLERISSASEIKINNNLNYFEDYFQPEEKINIFRIIQEAMNNVIKHANATEVFLRDEVKNGNLELSVSDNGVGFENPANQKKDKRAHLGIKGMKQRALMLNGKFSVESKPGKGTKIIIRFINRQKI